MAKKQLPTKLVLYLCWRAFKVAKAVSKSRKASKAAKARAKKSIPSIQKTINQIRVKKLKQRPINWK